MSELDHPHLLPALMGVLRQGRAEGELVLTQVDGIRQLFWDHGNLCYLHSDVKGEQLGPFLVRSGRLREEQLQELMSGDEDARIGERVVKRGLLSVEARDEALQDLFRHILLNTLEHPVSAFTWRPKPLLGTLSGDLQFHLDHRRLIWDTIQSMDGIEGFRSLLEVRKDWRWQAPKDLLDQFQDLPLTPTLAYSISLLGTEALSFGVLSSVTGLDPDTTARTVACFWALGGLDLAEGNLSLTRSLLADAVARTAAARPGPPPVAAPPPAKPQAPPAPRLKSAAEILKLDPPKPPEPAKVQAPPPPLPEPEPPKVQAPKAEPPKAGPEPAAEPALDLEAALPAGTPPEGVLAMPPAKRARALYHHGMGCAKAGRMSEAIRALEQSTQLDPDSFKAFEVWMALGRLRQGNPAWANRALDAFRAASALRPKDPLPWTALGEVYHRKRATGQARQAYDKARELDPEVPVPEAYLLPEPPEEAPAPSMLEQLGQSLRALLQPGEKS